MAETDRISSKEDRKGQRHDRNTLSSDKMKEQRYKRGVGHAVGSIVGVPYVRTTTQDLVFRGHRYIGIGLGHSPAVDPPPSCSADWYAIDVGRFISSRRNMVAYDEDGSEKPTWIAFKDPPGACLAAVPWIFIKSVSINGASSSLYCNSSKSISVGRQINLR